MKPGRIRKSLKDKRQNERSGVRCRTHGHVRHPTKGRRGPDTPRPVIITTIRPVQTSSRLETGEGGDWMLTRCWRVARPDLAQLTQAESPAEPSHAR